MIYQILRKNLLTLVQNYFQVKFTIFESRFYFWVKVFILESSIHFSSQEFYFWSQNVQVWFKAFTSCVKNLICHVLVKPFTFLDQFVTFQVKGMMSKVFTFSVKLFLFESTFFLLFESRFPLFESKFSIFTFRVKPFTFLLINEAI